MLKGCGVDCRPELVLSWLGIGSVLVVSWLKRLVVDWPSTSVGYGIGCGPVKRSQGWLRGKIWWG